MGPQTYILKYSTGGKVYEVEISEWCASSALTRAIDIIDPMKCAELISLVRKDS